MGLPEGMDARRRPANPDRLGELLLEQMFSAKAVERGSIIRRAKAVVDGRVGRERLIEEVRRRGFHLIECGGQYIVLCNPGQISIVC